MKTQSALLIFFATLPLGLAGCGGNTFVAMPTVAVAGISISGNVRGAQQPVAGAHVYLFAANTSGYGQPSLSLLQATATGFSDALGAYAVTDKTGAFSIAGAYSCTPNAQVYLFAAGGDAGHGSNPSIGLTAALGACPAAGNFSSVPAIALNELSTVAAAYALSGFAADTTHISSSGSAQALLGIANAFESSANLVNVQTGAVLVSTPAGNGVIPAATINTVADILASCAGSAGPRSPACVTLFANALAGGNTGVAPAETATAAINMAHNPGVNVAPLFALSAGAPPFTPALLKQPNDFTLSITFSGGGISGPSSIAVDGSGNVWTTSLGNNSVNELSSLGKPVSPAAGYVDTSVAPVSLAMDLDDNAWIANALTSSVTKLSTVGASVSPVPYGYTGGGMQSPQGIAISATGEAWVASFSNSVSRFSAAGTAISPPYGYTGGGLDGPSGIAVDPSGAVWVPNKSPTGVGGVTKFSAAGAALSPATGYIGGGLNQPAAIAIDHSGHAWVANFAGNSLTELDNSGNPLSGSSGFSAGGVNSPFAVAIDGAGSAWVTDYFTNAVSQISSQGAAISPAGGYLPGFFNSPQSIAIDPSGNVWVTNSADLTITEMIGAAAPVVTPISAAIKNNTLGTRP